MRTQNEYTEKALDFLERTNTTLEVSVAVPQTSPLWTKKGEKHGIKYSVTLKNKNHTYVFDFWGSIRDAELVQFAQECVKRGNTNNPQGDKVLQFLKENNIPIGLLRLAPQRLVDTVKELVKPYEYDVLACLDILHEDSFEDFCAGFGYDNDSILAQKTFDAVREQDRNLRKLFDREELELLADIN